MKRASRRLLLALPLLALVGCVHLPRPELPMRLSPASLGRELALQQRMTVTAFGHSQQFDIALEADADAVRLAVLAFGQTLARLEWDGRELRETRVRGWPPVITGGLVLRDLQLVHWPLDAIQPILPLGWTIQSDGDGRQVRFSGRTVIRVRYPAAGSAELDNLVSGYKLRLDPLGGVQ